MTPGSLQYKEPESAAEDLMNFILNMPASQDRVVEDMLMDTATESFYGIFDHSSPDHLNPVPAACVHKNVVVDGNVKSAYKKIMTLGLPKLTGMSLDELLSLPPVEFNMVVDIAKDLEADLTNVLEDENNK